MRIAIVNKFFFLSGGQETVALEQMRLLQDAGHEVAFFAMHHPKNPSGYYWSKYFVPYVDFSMRNEQYSPWQKMKAALRFVNNPEAALYFAAFLEEFKPDVIHCHGIAHQLTYSILKEAQKRDIPVVQTLHDFQVICPAYTLLQGNGSVCPQACSTQSYLPCVTNRCVKHSLAASALSAIEMWVNRTVKDYTHFVDTFISPSQFLANQVVQAGLPQHKVTHIPNFLVGIEQIEATPVPADGYFLYLGRLTAEKGLMTLVKAFEKLPHLTLRVAGEGSMRGQLEAYCQAQGLQNVTFLGHVDRSQVASLVQGCRAVVLPSQWYENQPMCIIEAYAYGRPVIGSNLGGIAEMVIPGQTGQLFEPGNVEDLVAAITRVVQTHQDESHQCAERAKSAYSASQHLHHLLRLYQQYPTYPYPTITTKELLKV